MADAIVVGQQDPQGPLGAKRSKVTISPSQASNNPVVTAQNVGSPGQPIRTMSRAIETILGEVNAQGVRSPVTHEEITPPDSGIPGATRPAPFTRTTW